MASTIYNIDITSSNNSTAKFIDKDNNTVGSVEGDEAAALIQLTEEFNAALAGAAEEFLRTKGGTQVSALLEALTKQRDVSALVLANVDITISKPSSESTAVSGVRDSISNLFGNPTNAPDLGAATETRTLGNTPAKGGFGGVQSTTTPAAKGGFGGVKATT